MILFEPDHPLIWKDARISTYSSDLSALKMSTFLNDIAERKYPHNWLLRNHISDEHKTSPLLIKEIWKQSKILGFKCIRWNHDLRTLADISNKQLIYIIRNPLAVVASLIKRTRFFEEFGWEWHWTHYKNQNPISNIDLAKYDKEDTYIKYAVMWTISNIKALYDINEMDIAPISYEKLYSRPFQEAKELFRKLGYDDVSIHPSHLFYPSMSTLKTFHTDSDRFDLTNGNLDFFWKDTLTASQEDNIRSTILDIASQFPTIHSTFKALNYL